MKKISFLLIILSLNIYFISTVVIQTSGKKDKYCVSKVINEEDRINLSYVISGENEEKVHVFLYDEDNKVIYEKYDSDSGDYKEHVKKAGLHKLCFAVVNNNQYYISFEFFTDFDKGHTLDMAKEDHIHEIKRDVIEITSLFEEVEKNIRFTMDRRNKHSEVVSDIINSIRNITFAKVIVILVVSIFQVIFIQRFFGGRKPNMNLSNNVFEMSSSL